MCQFEIEITSSSLWNGAFLIRLLKEFAFNPMLLESHELNEIFSAFLNRNECVC